MASGLRDDTARPRRGRRRGDRPRERRGDDSRDVHAHVGRRARARSRSRSATTRGCRCGSRSGCAARSSSSPRGSRSRSCSRRRRPASTSLCAPRSSGAFPLQIDVMTPDGQRRLATSRYTVRSTAVSGAGLVLSVGAGAFLVLWWARHWHRTRRSARLVAAHAHPATPQPASRFRRHGRPHRHRQRLRPRPGPGRSARHRGGAALHPLRRRGVRRPCRAERRRLLRQDGPDRHAAGDRGAVTRRLRGRPSASWAPMETRSSASTSPPRCRPPCSPPQTAAKSLEGEVASRSSTPGP